MKFALSTNWCNRRIESGEEIADKAIELGFEELELGFHTTLEQVKGFKARLDQIPVGSVHAFCPVPISAPQGYPELYQLASLDEDARAIARVHVRKNIEFAAEMGADAVVLHAGRVMCRGFFSRWDMKRRVKRGRKLIEAFKRELEQTVPILEKNKVTLGLENRHHLLELAVEDHDELPPPLHAAVHIPPADESAAHHAPRVQDDRVRPHLRGKLDVLLHMHTSNRPVVLIE